MEYNFDKLQACSNFSYSLDVKILSRLSLTMGFLIMDTGLSGRFIPHSFLATFQQFEMKAKYLQTVPGFLSTNNESRNFAILVGVMLIK
jgi:hypothetical protein